jgi:hypothetical protein
MNDTPTLVSQDDEAVERAKAYRLTTPITATQFGLREAES